MPNASSNKSQNVNLKLGARDKFFNRDLDFNELLAEITEVMVEAGYPSYEGALTGNTLVKSNPQARGIKVGMPSPNHSTVELKWQPKSGNRRCSFLVSAPLSVDKYRFQADLKSAVERLEERPKQMTNARTPKQKPARQESSMKEAPAVNQTGNVVPLFAPEDAPSFKAPKGNEEFDVVFFANPGTAEVLDDEVPEEAKAEQVAPTKPPEEPLKQEPPAQAGASAIMQYDFATTFAKDHVRVRTFMSKLTLGSRGVVHKSQCTTALISMNVGLEACAMVIRSLVLSRHLLETQIPLEYSIGKPWLEGFGERLAKAPVQKRAEPPTSMVAASGIVDADAVRNTLTALAAKVEAEDRLQARLKVINESELPSVQKRREELDSKIAALEEDRTRLARERNSLSDALNNPEFGKARKELASLRQILGIK